MENLFLKVLNLSISAAWVILAVVVLRFALQKAPKWVRVALWSVAGLRLVLPFSIESIFSLIPSAETVPADIGMAAVPAIHSGVPILNDMINPVLGTSMAATPQYSANPMQLWQAVAALVWVGGMVLMALYALISWLIVRIRVREAARERENVWVCDRIGSPFVLGIFFPRIYLPSDMAEADVPFVLAHEQAHLKRKDHWWKPLGFALLTVHWFNPAVWLAYTLLCRDIELACDERVLAQLGEGSKKPYSQALIHCSAPRRMITACPVAFGETGVKGRIKSVLHYKKPAFWLVLVAVIVCIAVAVCFLTDPKQPGEEPYDGTQPPSLQVSTIPKQPGEEPYDGTQPPGLQVSTMDGTVHAWSGGHHWHYVREDGQTVNSIADANHPTAEADKLPRLEARPTTVSSRKGNSVGLYFDLPADRVTVAAWPVDVTSSVGEIKVEATPEGFELLQGSFVYAVRGYWDDHGTAEYSFVGTYTVPVINAPDQELEQLKAQYPQYAQLPTHNGLYVFVWKMSPHGYYCGLGTSGEYDITGSCFGHDLSVLLKSDGLSFAQMRKLLSAYDVPQEDIHIVPFQHPYSSYLWQIDETTVPMLKLLFWGAEDFPVTDVCAMDADGDGDRELCALGIGPTSGVFSFRFLVRQPETGEELVTTYVCPWYELSFAAEDGVTYLRGVADGKTHRFDISVVDGAVSLTENGQPIGEELVLVDE